ncbi:MAG: exopolysaccharide biosynthesis polyprenyl glycosylphosphotransferase [Gammaproteobacteria bacterium]|nr:exopolysaccharide biosynthesis polyprenyl glycosylphosphotransferase [Gammaproteobacteria bacterium]
MTTYEIRPSLVTRIKRSFWRARFRLNTVAKRAMDIIIAFIALIALSPLLATVAVWIKLDSPGAVLFKQQRVGLNGVPFTMWKFRSMRNDAERIKDQLNDANEMHNGVIFKMKQDPRITTVGRFIRKTSIDELPQLFNVLAGDMSLVGPRPPLPSEVSEYQRPDRQRLAVLPGITCLWQISGRSDIPFEQQVQLDINYIEKQSLWFDLQVLLKTIPAVLLARGAY